MKSAIAVALAAAVGAIMFTLPALARQTKSLQVKTGGGRIEGKLSEDGQVRIFLGIPYAAPPVGPLRWKPPQPAAKWPGVRPAKEFGHRCVQFVDWGMIFRDPGESEDCLTLNVWAPVRKSPARKTREKLPVMVWIYGGGFIAGGTSEPRQDGTALAHKGVIVVSMNYRLGPLGFFATRELAAESPHHAAGNYGVLDQTAALHWVQKNIAAFGGDPKNVTIFGESAGSFSVSLQMATPLSRELFAHAIGESGGAFRQPTFHFPSLATREAQDEKFAQDSFGTTSLAALRALSAGQIRSAGRAESAPHFGPNVDGWYLPESVPAIYAAGKQAHVPLLAGWNKDEDAASVLFQPEPPTVESWRALAKKEFGDQAEEFLQVYPAADNQQALRSAEDFAGDKFIAYSTWAWIEAQAKTGDAPVYRYFFTLDAPENTLHPHEVGAFHSDDIEYVFGTLKSRPGVVWRPEDFRLSELIQAYWTNFARTGDPNGVGLPRWPVYDSAGQWQVMHLDAQPKVEPDRHRDRYLFLHRVWGGR